MQLSAENGLKRVLYIIKPPSKLKVMINPFVPNSPFLCPPESWFSDVFRG